MWEIVSRIVPPPLLFGLLIYALICFFWLQPAAETRMSAFYVARCEAGELPKVVVPAPEPVTRNTDANPSAPMEIPVSVQILKELNSLMRDDAADIMLPYETAQSPCVSAVSRAFDRAFWSSYLYVASLGTYTPRAIRYFDQYVARELAVGNRLARR